MAKRPRRPFFSPYHPPTGLSSARAHAYLWHIRRARAEATDVLVSFVALGTSTTRVDIVHSGWERLGADGPRWRDANLGGWNGLLPHFVAACGAR